MVKIAIMQPYLFPYPGYFEMMAEVDIFVFLTDVQYIRRGWVNRNRIRRSSDGDPMYFTVPVVKAPRSELILNMQIAGNEWVQDHLRMFATSYGKKAISHPMYEYYKTLAHYSNLCDMLCESAVTMADHLGIETEYCLSTEHPSELRGKDRIIELCKKFSADMYVNLPGGRELYREEEFAENGLKLKFMEPTAKGYLSILDTVFNV